MADAFQTHRTHRPSKVDKGKGNADHSKGHNPKAFVAANPRTAEKQIRRNAEKDQQRLHVPLVNRTDEEEAPPVIVAIVGPQGVGKTTLMRSLIRRFTKHTLAEIGGPVTVVSGKKRRLAFIECNNDLNSMIDIGKVADLVLLMIDGTFGFEMETMEFLNVLQAHAFPTSSASLRTWTSSRRHLLYALPRSVSRRASRRKSTQAQSSSTCRAS